MKPLQDNGIIGNSQGNPLKLVSKQGVIDKSAISKIRSEEGDGRIDIEIEEIEREIDRLSLRLEALRLEKAERCKKTVEKRGRIVSAKFMEQKQSIKNLDAVKKIEESLISSSKTRISRRGVSLGPAEIFTAVKSRPSMAIKPEITPVQSIQSRRKSCFFKLQDIDEDKETKERGHSLSLNPKYWKTVSKIQAPKQAVSTIGSKRPVKKDDGVISSIQPKKLFKDGEKSAPLKKPIKPGRVVASRYNQAVMNQANVQTTASEARKRSLPEDNKEESNKRHASRENGMEHCRGLKSESNRVKKRWEIPSEVVVYKGFKEEEEEECLVSISEIGNVLPKIRTNRCVNDSPRDSGAAKRVTDLVGRKTYFCAEEDEPHVGSVCQALRFDFEEEEAKEE
ncbi:hypothetical protein CFOL_v3_12353 [Cephalotus follicularis]|uniref:Uncharacterized protein n=1 Tax=Cephalotus follicularis TaxID=3775 RepID=A0A1Q3BLE7_CEPFO|nr:hypothetical protein CFOL_v3_12353 [Cephalotus follicularis]